MNTSHEESDAKLIAEAGNVYHESGLTPRELMDELKELRRVFAETARMYDRIGKTEGQYVAAEIRAALSKRESKT